MAKASDPTKDPEFQKVVQGFLRTKPKPHKKRADKQAKKRRTRKTEKKG